MANEAAIALLLLLTFSITAADAYQQLDVRTEFSVDAMLDRWSRCREVLDSIGGYECEVVGDANNGTFRNVSQIQIDGKFALKTILNVNSRLGKTSNEESYKVFANPNYSAAISLRGDGKWFLAKVLLRSDPSYTTNFREWFGDSRFVSITPEFIESLRSCATTSVIQEPTTGTRVFQVIFENVREDLVECTVEVAESHGLLPSSILFRNKDGTIRKHEFRNWIEYEGVTIWTKIVASIPGTQGNKLQYTWTPDILNRKPETDECYLSAYGLPEPALPSNARFYVFASVVVLLLAVMIVIARNRR